MSVETTVATIHKHNMTNQHMQALRNIGIHQLPSVTKITKFHNTHHIEVVSETKEIWNEDEQQMRVIRFGGCKDIQQRVIVDAQEALATQNLQDLPCFPLANHVLPGIIQNNIM